MLQENPQRALSETLLILIEKLLIRYLMIKKMPITNRQQKRKAKGGGVALLNVCFCL